MLTSGIHLELLWICFQEIDSYSFDDKKLSAWTVLSFCFFLDEETEWFQQLGAGQKFTWQSAYLMGDSAVLNDPEAGKPCSAGLLFWAMSPEEEA